ncbi:UNVERIFIED_CONTAM: hypothetical protein RMT77_013674 [Armadillidium vulgare]
MSDNDGPLHDPIIDTLEESDEASPRQEEEEQHSDNAHMESFNGDSLPTTGSPFKKGYGAGSLGEASVDSLVDEPLPIESVHLSPFRIETIHNSPLSGRQKDSHTFSVSVPDSLPPHVMELDSPEHYGDKMDEPFESEFCVEKVPPTGKVSEDEPFLIGGPIKSFPEEASDEPAPLQESLASILVPTQEFQKQKSDPSLEEKQSQASPKVAEMETQPSSILEKDYLTNEIYQESWNLERIFLGTMGSLDISSQADMFESQVETRSQPSSPAANLQTGAKEDFQRHSHQLSSKLSKDLPKETESSKDIEEGPTVADSLTPPSDVQGHSQNSPLPSLGIKRILSSAESSSPVKRKRDSLEEVSSDRKIIKKDRKELELEGESGRKQGEGWVSAREKPEETDSDIEILDSESFSSANQSVEVVFDKKTVLCDTTESVESQDLKLLLTGATQSEEEIRDVAHQGVDKESSSSQSPSLLSLPDSVSLTCNEHVSSSFLEENPSSGGGENTLQPTQVELICAEREAASTQHTSQPSIKPLINLPLVQGKVTSNSCNESTNNISSSNNNNNSSSSGSCNGNVNSLEHEEIRNRVESTVECAESQKSIDPYGSSEIQASDTAVSYPQFHVPSQIGDGSHGGVEEEEESVFVKAVRAAEKKKEQTRKLEIERNKTKGDLDYSSPLSFEVASKHSPYETVSTGDSNNSTPLCAINPTRYSQSTSTPISSQLAGEPSTWLFSKISQEHTTNSSDNSKNNIHKSNVRAGDSDDEQAKQKHSDILSDKNPKPNISSSTPNVSGRGNISPDSSKDEPVSDISKTNSVNSIVSLTSQNSNHVQSKMDTLEIESDDIHNAKDLMNSGWLNLGQRKFTLPTFECWENPSTKERVFSIVGADGVIKEDTPFSVLIRYATISKSGSREIRISDISSLSKSTTSSGYLADRSASLSNPEGNVKHESTRLSNASICVITPPQSDPHSIVKSTSDPKAKTDDEIFVYPQPRSFPPQPESVAFKSSSVSVTTDGDKIKRPYEISLTETETSNSDSNRVPRSRGRPRGRARGRGRGRGTEKVLIPPPITEEVKLGSSQSDSLSEKDNEYGEKFLSLLPEFLQQKLRNSQIPLTEDEEEIFILQKNQIVEKDQKNQFDQVCTKVRMAEIKQELLVFARYFDNNYYSAIIKEHAKEDRWRVQYNLDDLENDVREMYILPTEILPKGTSCYVMHPTQNYSDPGIVTSHIYQDGILIHVIEIQKGLIVKATHSHIILKTEVAEALNKSRYNFHSMIASPGVEVSLDNIVVGKRRRDTPSSPQKRLLKKMAPPPQPRKADHTLDTTDEGSTSKKQETVKTKRIPAAFSDTSSTESELYYSAIEETPKSGRKKAPKKSSASSKTPRSNTTKKQLLKHLIVETTDTTEEQTKSSSLVPLEKIGDEPIKYPPKKSKSSPVSKTPRKKIPKETQRVSSKSKESLLNPVVELIQLQEVKSSPKSVSKKRGRRPGSATKNPKKALKLEEGNDSSDEDVTGEIDPSLGPLPPSGCQLFKGYTILITHAINVQKVAKKPEDKSPLPMNKDYLKKQIIAGGGHVVESFQEAYHELHQFLQTKKTLSKDDTSNKGGKKNSFTTLPASESPSRVLCVSNDCCRTAKYIQCLTVGIPLVNMEWVITSITLNQCLNWSNYLLPAGYSIITGYNIEQIFGFQNISTNVGKVTEVVKDEKVFLASSSNPEFGELWHHLLTVANAAVFKMPPKGGNLQRLIDRKTDFVIADNTIPEQELRRAQELNVPVVSSEWFIQSLIVGYKLPFDVQPQFKYDYKASSSDPSGSRDNHSEEDVDSER